MFQFFTQITHYIHSFYIILLNYSFHKTNIIVLFYDLQHFKIKYCVTLLLISYVSAYYNCTYFYIFLRLSNNITPKLNNIVNKIFLVFTLYPRWNYHSLLFTRGIFTSSIRVPVSLLLFTTYPSFFLLTPSLCIIILLLT